MRTLLAILIFTSVAGAAEIEKYEGRYYIIHTDLKGDDLREAELRMAKMAEEYHNRTKEFSGQVNEKFPFYLFRKEEDYFAAGGKRGSGGFFDSNNNTLMAIAGEEVTADTWSTVQHEGFHQFAKNVIGGSLPVWVNEGLAEYFGEGVFTGDGFITGVIPPQRLKRIRAQMRSNEFRPIREVMFLAHADWNKELTLANYDQAWSMVHFLAHAENGRYQGAFVSFMRAIGSGQKWERAWLAHFGPADGFEQKWKDYWLRLPENPTAYLYHRAMMQVITGALARATAKKQTFANFDELLEAARSKSLQMDDRDWLPPTLVASAFKRAAAMREKGSNFTLNAGRAGRLPTILCAANDGTRLLGRFTIQSDQLVKVTVEQPSR